MTAATITDPLAWLESLKATTVPPVVRGEQIAYPDPATAPTVPASGWAILAVTSTATGWAVRARRGSLVQTVGHLTRARAETLDLDATWRAR